MGPLRPLVRDFDRPLDFNNVVAAVVWVRRPNLAHESGDTYVSVMMTWLYDCVPWTGTLRVHAHRTCCLVPVVLAGLVAIPLPLAGQEDSTVRLRPGERVRVWSPTENLRGKAFRLGGVSRDSIVLRDPRADQLLSLAHSQVELVEVQRESGENYFWRGVGIGGGVGLAADLVWAGIGCSSTTVDSWVSPCMVWAPAILSPFTVLPGALLGGLVGAQLPRYEWIEVDLNLGPRTEPGSSWSQTAVSLRVQLRIRGFP